MVLGKDRHYDIIGCRLSCEQPVISGEGRLCEMGFEMEPGVHDIDVYTKVFTGDKKVVSRSEKVKFEFMPVWREFKVKVSPNPVKGKLRI